MKLLNHFEGFISGNIKVVSTFFSLIKLEAKLAGLTVLPLLFNLCMLFVVLMTVWISAMGLLGLSVNLLIKNAIASVSLILFVNLVLLFILKKSLVSNLNKMTFVKTRESLKKRATPNESTS